MRYPYETAKLPDMRGRAARAPRSFALLASRRRSQERAAHRRRSQVTRLAYEPPALPGYETTPRGTCESRSSFILSAVA